MTAKERHTVNLLLFYRLGSLLSENQSREALLLSGDLKVMFCHLTVINNNGPLLLVCMRQCKPNSQSAVNYIEQ